MPEQEPLVFRPFARLRVTFGSGGAWFPLLEDDGALYAFHYYSLGDDGFDYCRARPLSGKPDYAGAEDRSWLSFAAEQEEQPLILRPSRWTEQSSPDWQRGWILFRRWFFQPSWDWYPHLDTDDLPADPDWQEVHARERTTALHELLALARDAEERLTRRSLVPLSSRAWLTAATAGSSGLMLPEAEPEQVVPPVVSLADRPPPRIVKGHREAEHVAAEWMQWFGFEDAAVTQATRDGGVDVRSARAVAQVKMEAKPVAAYPVQALAGVAAVGTGDQADALFFSSSGYTVQAVEFADRAGVALFEFAIDGDIKPVNEPAFLLYELGGSGARD